MKAYLTAGEDGSLLIEWIRSDERFSVSLESNIKDSCWVHVAKPDLGESDYLDERSLAALRSWLEAQIKAHLANGTPLTLSADQIAAAERESITFDPVRCDRCGRWVAANWLVRHRKAGCKVGASEAAEREEKHCE